MADEQKQQTQAPSGAPRREGSGGHGGGHRPRGGHGDPRRQGGPRRGPSRPRGTPPRSRTPRPPTTAGATSRPSTSTAINRSAEALILECGGLAAAFEQ